jgi:hypothetical protein
MNIVLLENQAEIFNLVVILDEPIIAGSANKVNIYEDILKY